MVYFQFPRNRKTAGFRNPDELQGRHAHQKLPFRILHAIPASMYGEILNSGLKRATLFFTEIAYKPPSLKDFHFKAPLKEFLVKAPLQEPKLSGTGLHSDQSLSGNPFFRVS